MYLNFERSPFRFDIEIFDGDHLIAPHRFVDGTKGSVSDHLKC